MLTSFGLILTACILREADRLWWMQFPKGQTPQGATGRFKRDWDWWVAYLINCAYLSIVNAIGWFIVIGAISFAFFGGLGFRE
jgi:hypothetical protein